MNCFFKNETTIGKRVYYQHNNTGSYGKIIATNGNVKVSIEFEDGRKADVALKTARSAKQIFLLGPKIVILSQSPLHY